VSPRIGRPLAGSIIRVGHVGAAPCTSRICCRALASKSMTRGVPRERDHREGSTKPDGGGHRIPLNAITALRADASAKAPPSAATSALRLTAAQMRCPPRNPPASTGTSQRCSAISWIRPVSRHGPMPKSGVTWWEPISTLRCGKVAKTLGDGLFHPPHRPPPVPTSYADAFSRFFGLLPGSRATRARGWLAVRCVIPRALRAHQPRR
jgi:hypothetical protein